MLRSFHNRALSCYISGLYTGMGACCGAVGLRHCATSWKVAGSIPDGVIGICH